jgi:hypothetical protein
MEIHPPRFPPNWIVPPDMPEPYRALFLTYADLWEQLQIAKTTTLLKRNAVCSASIEHAQGQLAILAASLKRVAERK